MTRIVANHGKSKLSDFAIFHFFLAAGILISGTNEAAGVDAAMQKIGRHEFDSLANSGCLFFEQTISGPANSVLPAANEIAENRSNGILQRIGARITCGIVESRRALGCVACFGDAVVDLPSLITTNLDQQFTTVDVYWQYYTHCDRWEVAFNNRVITPRRTDLMQDMVQRCRQTYLQLQFAVIENLPNGQLVSSKNHRRPAYSDLTAYTQRLSAWLSDFANHPLLCYWNSLSAMRNGSSQSGISELPMNQLLDLLTPVSFKQPNAGNGTQ